MATTSEKAPPLWSSYGDFLNMDLSFEAELVIKKTFKTLSNMLIQFQKSFIIIYGSLLSGVLLAQYGVGVLILTIGVMIVITIGANIYLTIKLRTVQLNKLFLPFMNLMTLVSNTLVTLLVTVLANASLSVGIPEEFDITHIVAMMIEGFLLVAIETAFTALSAMDSNSNSNHVKRNDSVLLRQTSTRFISQAFLQAERSFGFIYGAAVANLLMSFYGFIPMILCSLIFVTVLFMGSILITRRSRLVRSSLTLASTPYTSAIRLMSNYLTLLLSTMLTVTATLIITSSLNAGLDEDGDITHVLAVLGLGFLLAAPETFCTFALTQYEERTSQGTLSYEAFKLGSLSLAQFERSFIIIYGVALSNFLTSQFGLTDVLLIIFICNTALLLAVIACSVRSDKDPGSSVRLTGLGVFISYLGLLLFTTTTIISTLFINSIFVSGITEEDDLTHIVIIMTEAFLIIVAETACTGMTDLVPEVPTTPPPPKRRQQQQQQ